MGEEQKEKERWMAIAYLALCALQELDEESEAGHFRRTRLDLHQHLEGRSPDPPDPRTDGGRPLLRVVQ
jgi:hypothetical protein